MRKSGLLYPSLFLILFLIIIGCTVKKSSTKNSEGKLTEISSMIQKRAAHTATLLKDGRVLIAGGIVEDGSGNELPLTNSEIYNPETNQFNKISGLVEQHCNHSASLLESGEVLIIAGWKTGARSDAIEIFNPETNTFRLATRLEKPLQAHNAVLLNDGKVLIVGGNFSESDYAMNAYLYDYKTNSLTKTGKLNYGRMAFTATLLKNGNVLIAGGRNENGVLNKAEIYNSATGEFELKGDLKTNRYKHGASVMENGNVILIGGSDKNDWNGKYKSAEVYDAELGEFTELIEMNAERFKLQEGVVMLADGNILAGGGNKVVEIFNPAANKFITAGEIDDVNYYTCLTLLRNGNVLITGGYNNKIVTTDKAYIFKM